jgi:hypothetical protein
VNGGLAHKLIEYHLRDGSSRPVAARTREEARGEGDMPERA